MTNHETLDQRLQTLAAAVAPSPSFTENVMSRVSQTQVLAPRPAILHKAMTFMSHRRIPIAVACLVAAAFFAAWPFVGNGERDTAGWWLAPTTALAQELVTALKKASTSGMTAREQTTFILPDGTRHVSSSTSKYFLSPSRYRRDLYDEKQLRESQWYVPDGDQMIQTGVRWKAKTYQIDKHPGSSKDIDRLEQMRSIVGAVDRADRKLGTKEVDGQKCVGFEISGLKLEGGERQSMHRIWFNAETKLPTRIETEIPKLEKTDSSSTIQGLVLVLDHMDWNPSLPANTFEPEIPGGFKEVHE